jgi:hypothetical protein
MSTLIQTKTNFTAGELAPELLGRGDLRAYENGAARLRNVFIHPTGGVTRRAGLRHVDLLPGAGRLIAFAFNTEQTYLLAVTDGRITVFMDEATVMSFAAPWTAGQLAQIDWTQSADSLLIVHPEVEPHLITRSSHTAWSISPWPVESDDDGVPRMPFNRIARADLSLRTSGPTSGNCVIHADKPYFTAAHQGVHIMLRGIAVALIGYQDSQHMEATIHGTLPSSAYTLDWSEQAWSAAHGWPASVTFHQDRLVIGGSRDLPNHLWFSRSGAFFDFDAGSGLDDEAIDFPMLSDQVNAIRHVFSGRHLQVFTTGAEWTVAGEPLTPTNVEVRRQTRVGSAADRKVPPHDVDGATLFAAASGRELREFLYSDSEAAYQATDIALLSRHLFRTPVDMDYDPVRRLVHVVMADGTLATVTNFRREQVTAWTRQDTAGAFRAVAVAGGETYVVTERQGAFAVEAFDDALATDAGLTGTSATQKVTWSGLNHLEGREVRVKSDGVDIGVATVTGGAVTLAEPAAAVEIGLAFAHVVEPLPPLPEGPRGGGNGRQMRLVRASFRLLDTPLLSVDTGRGATVLSFKRFADQGVLDSPPPAFTGDATVRAIGWQRDAIRPLWTVAQDIPLPCTILSVTTETKVTD